MNFLCPHCKVNLKCDEGLAGQVLRCPKCAGKITVETLDPGPGATEETRNEADTPDAATQQPAAGRPDGASGSPPAAWQPTDTSNVSILASAAGGIALTLLFYLITFPLRKTYLGELFWSRGWVPVATVLPMFWAVSILLLKLRQLRQQRRAMLLDVLPASIGDEITIQNVPKFLAHIAQLPTALQQSLIVRRMQLGLQHFQVRHSNPEVANLMMSQSEIDAGTISSSYALLKVFLWAIPILGFVGTVLGISNAVGGFSGSLEAASDITVLKASLNNVTMGLAVAFDTTLVALVLSLLLSFPASAMQKAEEDLLAWLDAYCNENLLKRLNDTGGLPTGGGDVETVVKALTQTLTHSQQNILMEFRQVQENMGKVQEIQVELLQKMAEAVATQLAKMEERAQAHQANLDQQTQAHQANLAKQVQEHRAKVETDWSKVVTPIAKTMQEISRDTRALESRAGGLIEETTVALRVHMAAIAEGLGKLNHVLADLGAKQVVIQQVHPRPWFAFFSRK